MGNIAMGTANITIALRSDLTHHAKNTLTMKPILNIQFMNIGNLADIYGKIKAGMDKKGIPLTEPDLRIASIALCYKLVLVTGNVKHFSKVPGLSIENWL